MAGELPEVNKELGRSNSPLLWGSVFFILLWLAAQVSGIILVGMRKMSKNNRSIYQVSVTMAAICMWMMWAMVWLSQLNPVLLPVGVAHHGSHDDDHNL